jgi:FkbM family methyltransferase
LKEKVIYLLQQLLGFENYLWVFSNFKIKSLRNDKKEGDFFYFLDLIGPSDQVFDIGANIGIMTYFLSKGTPQGSVISFEPVTENIATLKRIMQQHTLQNVTLHETALGDAPGEIEMVMPQLGKAKKQGLSHVVHPSIEGFEGGVTYTVPVVTLDELVKQNQYAPKAIKLDVENFEYFVLKGAEATIAKHHPIIYTELWDNENRQKCFDLLNQWGYMAKVVVKKQLVDYDKTQHTHQNFIFLPHK